ncbi:hypothetical protein G8770_17060 [Aestuariicella hydrocarbonica]|uniref:Uncharacterized protein n=1 Tax=Pseudomaricurvus hydrocarbonicus TaxID=1470433 RepID=A0A9E5T1D6_9GAMM|nr:hypothetical protein [Aestuariicella hydrocarbonica]NHO67260.1 hypothetical protein [Aestuariicella hydrocarbonica]
MNYGDQLRDCVSVLQLDIVEGAAMAPHDIQVQLYRDHVDFKVLDQLDQHFKQQTPIPEHAADSFTAFILSKPLRMDSTLVLHAMQCLNEQGEPNGELWVKFKSTRSLTNLDKDVTELGLHALQLRMLKDQPLPACEAKVAPSGPEWLRTGIDLGVGLNAGSWQLPVLETPLDVPERFAGHLYLKLLTVDHPVWHG